MTRTVRIDCPTWDDFLGLVELLCQVPDEAFRPVDVSIAGKPLYRLVLDPETGLLSSAPV